MGIADYWYFVVHTEIPVMVTIELFEETALSFPETSVQPHFEKTSFRVGKKILYGALGLYTTYI
jgi:hypothetical protein